MSSSEEIKGRASVRRIAILGSIAIVLLWGGSGAIIMEVFPDDVKHGTFGDLFGAINSLFSGFAFLGVIITILLQREELIEQRKEISLARKAHEETATQLKRQAEIIESTSFIEAYNHIIAAIDKQLEGLRDEMRHDAADLRRSL